MFRSAVLEPSVAVEFGDVKLLSGRRMDCLDREPEAETRHDSTRPFVLGFVDTDDLIEATLLKPVVLSCPSGLGGVSAAAERFAAQHREIVAHLFHGIHEVRGSIPLISTT